MTDTTNRLRVTVGELTLEIEGDAAFFDRHSSVVAAMTSRLEAAPASTPGSSGRTGRHGTGGSGEVDDEAPLEFGEQLGALPGSAGGTDQMLLAGLAAQKASDDNTFATRDANQLLLEQSIRVGNPSQCMTNNLKAKRVFKVGNRYRVSRGGEEYLAGLLGG